MIIGENREAVIKNIAAAAESGDFHSKVELNDPVLTAQECHAITDRFMAKRKTASFKFKSFVARQIANALTAAVNRKTEIKGMENLPQNLGAAIITSNHFSPIENTVIRHLTRKLGRKRLNIVSQITNLAMPGMIGFLMNYADIIPLSDELHYMNYDFSSVLSELFAGGEVLLIYPEQEMWFNYRKPRPLKRGAYYYAAKAGVPIVCCFVEMTDLGERDKGNFNKIKYTLHILGTLYPDKNKTVKQNSIEMCQRDYELKKSAYENAYGKKLDYRFEKHDIAGWVGNLNE